MDKTFIVFLLIGGIFFYFVMDIVNKSETEDERLSSPSYQQEEYAKYQKTDNIGQYILDVTSADVSTQTKVWNASSLKIEFLEIFPDFDTMRGFVKNRVQGDPLVKKLLKKINEVEDGFFSGTMNAEQAKKALEEL
jgi:hypothetical protein